MRWLWLNLAGLAGSWVLFSSCSPRHPEPRPVAPLQHTAPKVVKDPPLQVYLPVGQRLPGPFDDRQQFLIDGIRVEVTSNGISAAGQIAKPSLQGGMLLPEHLRAKLVSTQFLFWSEEALFSSAAFLADLHPIATTNSRPVSVSIGPQFALIREHSGNRWALDLASGLRTRISPLGLVDVAMHEDGQAAALLEAGRVSVSIDNGKTWKEITDQALPWASAVRLDGDGLWIVRGNGMASRVEKDGRLTGFPGVPSGSGASPGPRRTGIPGVEAADYERDPRWGLRDEPIQRAVSRGAPIDDHTAVVEAAGSLVRVDLRTGGILDSTHRVLPPDMDCTAMRDQGQVLLVCRRGRDDRIVASASLWGEPAVEKVFSEGGTFYSGGGTLVLDRPCSAGDRNRPAICVRRAGKWRELDVRDENADVDAGPRTERNFRRWIPTTSGGAIAVVGSPAFGFFDAQTRSFHECAANCEAKSIPELATPLRDAVVDRSWVGSATGVLRGWVKDGAVAVQLDGSVVRSAYRFSAVRGEGDRGFACEKGRSWLSVDHGERWEEVLSPPWSGQSCRPASCSDVGCDLGSWLRLGWREEPPALGDTPIVAPPPPVLPSRAKPILDCVATGPTRIGTAQGLASGEREPGFGARLLLAACQDQWEYGLKAPRLGDDLDTQGECLGAMVCQRIPPNANADDSTGLNSVFDWWFAEPFDPAMAVQARSIQVRQVPEAVREHLTEASNRSGNQSLAVLPTSPSGLGGLIHGRGGTGIAWLRQTSPQLAILSYSIEQSSTTQILGAASVDEGRLAILVMNESHEERALELTTAGARTLFRIPALSAMEQYPANADALAIGPKGDMAVIRIPSGAEPATSDDPAFVIHVGQHPVELAPWTTIRPADSAECLADLTGYRAVIHTDVTWLAVRLASALVEFPGRMNAQVRWNQARVCLEAVSIEAEPVAAGENTIPTRVVARFDGKGMASRVGLMLGAEYRAPLSCAIRP